MADPKNKEQLPEGFMAMQGSERPPSINAKLIGAADENEIIKLIIVLRRRTDGPPMPDMDYFAATPPGKRKRYTRDEFETNYGAHPDDIAAVTRFAENSGLMVFDIQKSARNVRISGTISQINKIFGVSLSRYERTITHDNSMNPHTDTEIYRGFEGQVHIPKDLAEIVLGVIGLDNRTIAKHGSSSYPAGAVLKGLSIDTIAQLYKFPQNEHATRSYQIRQASDQTIGIVDLGSGFLQSDLDSFFSAQYAGQVPPLPIPVPTVISADGKAQNIAIKAHTKATTRANNSGSSSVLTFDYSDELHNSLFKNQSNPDKLKIKIHKSGATEYLLSDTTGSATLNARTITVTLSSPVLADVDPSIPVYFHLDGECTIDISIAAAAAPGAKIVLFIGENNDYGMYSIYQAAIHPADNTTPVCSVLSSSWNGGFDTPNSSGVFDSDLSKIHHFFKDAALLGDMTVCCCTMDHGSTNGVTTSTVVPGTHPPKHSGDGLAHVAYPASDPYILSVGGTTIADVKYNDSNEAIFFNEYLWNDIDQSNLQVYTQWGATGGGVSDYFGLPSYQGNAGIPPHLNSGIIKRGIPDVAGNSSLKSAYKGIFLGGNSNTVWGGTSCAAPLWAGLIAQINSSLGVPVGFINHAIYVFGNSQFNYDGLQIFNVIADGGPTTNRSNSLTHGYQLNRNGWDPCKGWGSPNATNLLKLFAALHSCAAAISSIKVVDISEPDPKPMIKQRPANQLSFLYGMRDKFLSVSPRGREYIDTFYAHRVELVKIFCMRPGILRMVDDLVNVLMNEFDINNVSTAKLNKDTTEKVKLIMNEVGKSASGNLKLAIEKHSAEIDEFAGVPLIDVLNRN